VKYVAIHIQVQAPTHSGGSRAKSALTIVADQIKNFLEHLQMIDKSALLIPFQARDRIDTDIEVLDDPELVEADCDLIKVYCPEFYVHNRDTFMYSKVLMCFNEPFEDLLQKSCGTLLGGGQAMYKQLLQVEDTTIVGSLLYSHCDVPIECLCDKLSQMSGYHIPAWWKAADMGRWEPGHEPTRLMHTERPAKQKWAVQRFLQAMYI
jgi:hypothetical protein